MGKEGHQEYFESARSNNIDNQLSEGNGSVLSITTTLMSLAREIFEDMDRQALQRFYYIGLSNRKPNDQPSELHLIAEEILRKENLILSEPETNATDQIS